MRMGRTLIVCAAVALAAWAVPLSWGQDIDRFMLTEADFRALPPDAREEYLAGTDALNHVDLLAAHAHYRRAAEMAPDSAAMQFKLFELSQHQARLAAGDRRQEDYLVVGQEALQRVAESPVASVEERRRAETQIQFLQRRLSDIESQEAGRREMGRSFLHAYTLEQDWFRVGQRFPAMTRMIATASGAGQALTRSQVVLVNEAGQVFHADMTPFYDENGRHMTQGDMADYTFEAEPDEAFFRGESETASLAPGPAAGSLPPVPRAPAPPSAATAVEPAEAPAEETPAEDPPPAGEPMTGGSLQPAVLPDAVVFDDMLDVAPPPSAGIADEFAAAPPPSGDDFFDATAAPAEPAPAPDAVEAAPAEPPAAPAPAELPPAEAAPADPNSPFNF